MFKFYLALSLSAWLIAGLMLLIKKLIPEEYLSQYDDIIAALSIIGGMSSALTLMCI